MAKTARPHPIFCMNIPLQMEERNIDGCTNTSDNPSTSDKNLVCFDAVT